MKTTYLILLFLFTFQVSFYSNNNYLWKDTDKTFDLLGERLEKAVQQDENLIKFDYIIKQMYRIAEEKKNSVLLVRSLYWDSYTKLKVDKDSAEYLIKKALSKIDSLNYSYDYSRLLFNKGNLLISKGNYLEAYLLYKKLITYFLSVNDYLFAGKAYINIGYIFDSLQEYQKPLEYLQNADKCFTKGGHQVQATKNALNIANTLSQQHQQEKALKILYSLLENEVARKDSVFLVSILVNLDCMSQNKDEKYKYSKMAYETAKLIKDKISLIYTLANLGAYYFSYKADYDSALYYYKQAYHYSLTHKDAYSISHILYGLAENYAQLGQVDSAYYYLNNYIVCKDSIIGNDKIFEINKQEERIAIEKYESELKQAEEKATWHRKLTFIIVFFILSFSTLFCYTFWLLRKKEKIKKQLKEAENNKLNEQLKNETLLKERFQVELEYKNRELTSNTLVIAEKNQTLKRLLEQIEKLVKEKILPKKQETTLKQIIKIHLENEDEWLYFKQHFETVHPDFFKKLKHKFPILSENDLHLCAFIRIGMSTKQMAQMLSVLPETINMGRYRMRKKIGLSSEESLEDFLRNY